MGRPISVRGNAPNGRRCIDPDGLCQSQAPSGQPFQSARVNGLTGSNNAMARLWSLPTRPANGEENALNFFIKLIRERKKDELFGELGMQALPREFQRGETSPSTCPPSGSLLRGWLAGKMLLRFPGCLCGRAQQPR